VRRRLAFLLLAALLALGWTGVESLRGRGDAEGTAFQQMTGGLGMGATVAPYYDFATFDPRLEPDCTCGLWPVPGGWLFSPEHRSSPWDPPETLWRAVTPETLREERR
jgi:hypothetical protein